MYLVTADIQLQHLGPYQGVIILRPRTFLDRLNLQRPTQEGLGRHVPGGGGAGVSGWRGTGALLRHPARTRRGLGGRPAPAALRHRARLVTITTITTICWEGDGDSANGVTAADVDPL